MTDAGNPATTAERELILTRLIDAPRENLFRAWTQPELLKQWFAPLPWTTPVAELDVRPGGASLVVIAHNHVLLRRLEPIHKRLKQGHQ